MSHQELLARPNIEQYKNQAKDLVRDYRLGIAGAFTRARLIHPRVGKLTDREHSLTSFSRTDAQLIIAREHGFESWPKFARHIELLRRVESLDSIADPVAAFIEFACVPRHSDHGSGTLDHANTILAKYPQVAEANIHAAAILADEAAVRGFLAHNPANATAKGGPNDWDALTHLCFSRYLRLDQTRSEAFVRTARALLDAGADANTGWIEMIDHPNPRPTRESVIYGAAGIAQHAGLTRLLLERGADPNDEETPYHVPEGYDNTVLQILLESGKLNPGSLVWMLVRKTDWHDEKGLQLLLDFGADPNAFLKFGNNALQHAVLRDNGLRAIKLLLDHGADPAFENRRDGRSAFAMAARRGRADVLTLFAQRGLSVEFQGLDALVAACAQADRPSVARLTASHPHLIEELRREGGTLLAEFAGNGNAEGLACLLDLGVSPAALYENGDGYFDIPKKSTALHVAAWRARPSAVETLLDRGAPVNALDAKGRTALALAVKACVNSHWTNLRSPDSVAMLLQAGATVSDIEIPCGYAPVDNLLLKSAELKRASSPDSP